MKKLNILKRLIDVFWIMLCILSFALFLFTIAYLVFGDSIVGFLIERAELQIGNVSIVKVITLSFFFLISLTIAHVLYLFKKALEAFQKQNPFSNIVVANFNKIGKLLIVVGIVPGLFFFVLSLFPISDVEFFVEFGSNLITICMGLFFIVLSEVFKVAKMVKEENELTI